MKGNIFRAVVAAKDGALNKLKIYLESRTPRQRIRIVVIAFLLFAVLDVWMISRAFSGDSSRAETNQIETIVKP